MKNKKGFVFSPSKENLLRFSTLNAKDKLIWLAEANNFVRLAVSPKKLRLWEKFRKGEL